MWKILYVVSNFEGRKLLFQVRVKNIYEIIQMSIYICEITQALNWKLCCQENILCTYIVWFLVANKLHVMIWFEINAMLDKKKDKVSIHKIETWNHSCVIIEKDAINRF